MSLYAKWEEATSALNGLADEFQPLVPTTVAALLDSQLEDATVLLDCATMLGDAQKALASMEAGLENAARHHDVVVGIADIKNGRGTPAEKLKQIYRLLDDAGDY